MALSSLRKMKRLGKTTRPLRRPEGHYFVRKQRVGLVQVLEMEFDVDFPIVGRYLGIGAIGAVVFGSISAAGSALARGKPEALVGTSLMALMLLLEFAQRLVPARSLEIAEEVANALGGACGMALTFPFRTRRGYCGWSG